MTRTVITIDSWTKWCDSVFCANEKPYGSMVFVLGMSFFARSMRFFVFLNPYV